MALVIGTNCGFVTTAPTSDPEGSYTSSYDYAQASKFTSPTGAGKVIEIGWWDDRPTTSEVSEVGIYSHDAGNDKPDVLLGSGSFAKGTDGGWQVKTGLNISITEETIYWIAMSMPQTTNATRLDRGYNGYKSDIIWNQEVLPSPWGTSDTSLALIYAFYAVWEEAVTGFTRKIKISGTFQDKPIKTKVAGTFEDKPIKIKVGGTFQDA